MSAANGRRLGVLWRPNRRVVSTSAFGSIKRHVRLLDKRLHSRGITLIERQANARRDDERLLLDDGRRAHCLDDLVGYDRGHLGPLQGFHDHGELVATQPSNHIGGPKGLRQSSCERSQQRVSRVVARTGR